MSLSREPGTATTLRHNPLNAVTATVERITHEDGSTYIRKELRQPVQEAGAAGVDEERPRSAPGGAESGAAGPGSGAGGATSGAAGPGAGAGAGGATSGAAGPGAGAGAGGTTSGAAGPGAGAGAGGTTSGAAGAGVRSWAASTDPRHWNYWRREADVYLDDEVRAQLLGTGLVLPGGEVEEVDGGAVLYLEDVAGRAGTEFGLEDHAALARAVGRWQARPAVVRPWTSVGFLREYSTTREVPWNLLYDDAAWRQPLVAENWPAGLREGWERVVAQRDELLTIVEQAPRAGCHLDLWVCNAIRREDGEIALLDWAFCGDGALREDIGNHIPDAVFDLFWPAERLPELAETCIESYLEGLREGGWRGEADVVRRAVMAAAVKYAWLLPGLLGRASDSSHKAYHQEADSRQLFQQRGIALKFVADWCAEALKG